MSLNKVHTCDGCQKTVSQKVLLEGDAMPKGWCYLNFQQAGSHPQVSITTCSVDCITPAIHEALGQFKQRDDAYEARRKIETSHIGEAH